MFLGRDVVTNMILQRFLYRRAVIERVWWLVLVPRDPGIVLGTDSPVGPMAGAACPSTPEDALSQPTNPL